MFPLAYFSGSDWLSKRPGAGRQLSFLPGVPGVNVFPIALKDARRMRDRVSVRYQALAVH